MIFQNISRRQFMQTSALGAMGFMIGTSFRLHPYKYETPYFNLKPIGRKLAIRDYYVWCSSPIWDENGKVQLFYSRWKKEKGMSGWINGSEICRAEANSPYDDFEHKEIIFAPRGGNFWDATTCHNPLITKVDNTYYLFYMGNSNGKTNTKRIGIATSKDLDGKWCRPEKPALLPGNSGEWDDHCTTNPAFVKGNDGLFWLYYKSWNTAEYENQTGAVRGNRKYGLAKSKSPLEPFQKIVENPIIDFSNRSGNAQLEDAFIWEEKGIYHMVCRDMGFFNHEFGLHLKSKDGVNWSEPEIAYLNLAKYISETDPPKHLKRFGRLERPMLLADPITNEPKFLFGATQGGEYETSTTFVFEIISRN